MEIVLLIILIFLIIIFQSGQNTKINELDSQLKGIKKLLEKLNSAKTPNLTKEVQVSKPKQPIVTNIVTEPDAATEKNKVAEKTSVTESSLPQPVKVVEDISQKITEQITTLTNEIISESQVPKTPPIIPDDLKIVPPVKLADSKEPEKIPQPEAVKELLTKTTIMDSDP